MTFRNAFKFAFPQNTQESDLRLLRKLSKFIEVDCAAVSEFEPAHAPL